MQKIVEKLASAEGGKKVSLNPDLLAPNYSPLYNGWLNVAEVLGAERPTLFTDCGNTSSTSATASGENGSSRSTTKSSTAPRPPTTTTPSTNCGKRPRTRASGPKRPTTRPKSKSSSSFARNSTRPGRRSSISGTQVERRSREGDGQRRPRARLGQHLDAADHQSHRHAGHRRADDDRREGLRQRPRPDPEGLRRSGRGPAERAGGGGRLSRPEHGQGLPGDPARSRPGRPLRRERRRHLGRGRGGPGRQGDYDDGRRPRAVPRAGPLRPQLPPGRGRREEPPDQRRQRRWRAKPRAAA